MSVDLDDLIGSTKRSDPSTLRTIDLHHVVGGVSVPWLVKAFRMGRGKVEAALKECRPIATHPNGGLYYDLPEAAAFLVKPKKDLRELLKTISDKDLPHEMREGFWNAKLKEMKARAMAQELWPTQSVMEVFAEAFKTIKSTTQLWADGVENEIELTDEQREIIIQLSDSLMSELHQALVAHAKAEQTPSYIAELESAVEET